MIIHKRVDSIMIAMLLTHCHNFFFFFSLLEDFGLRVVHCTVEASFFSFLFLGMVVGLFDYMLLFD